MPFPIFPPALLCSTHFQHKSFLLRASRQCSSWIIFANLNMKTKMFVIEWACSIDSAGGCGTWSRSNGPKEERQDKRQHQGFYSCPRAPVLFWRKAHVLNSWWVGSGVTLRSSLPWQCARFALLCPHVKCVCLHRGSHIVHGAVCLRASTESGTLCDWGFQIVRIPSHKHPFSVDVHAQCIGSVIHLWVLKPGFSKH